MVTFRLHHTNQLLIIFLEQEDPKGLLLTKILSCCLCEVSSVCYQADERGLAVKPACLALEVSPQGLKLSSGLLVLLDGASTSKRHTVSPTGALMNPLQPCSDAS